MTWTRTRRSEIQRPPDRCRDRAGRSPCQAASGARLRPSLKAFLGGAEEGTQAMEFLLIIATTVVACMAAILLLEQVLREYLGFETVIITSPFF